MIVAEEDIRTKAILSGSFKKQDMVRAVLTALYIHLSPKTDTTVVTAERRV